MTLGDFDVKSGGSIEPSQLETEFERFYHNVLPHLTTAMATKLYARINTLELVPHVGADDVAYGANYDITVEVQGLISAVRAMQNSVMDERGRIREGITPREMKEVVTSTSSLMNLLMKSHEKLMTFDRQRAMEQATVDVLRALGDGGFAGLSGEEIVSRFVEMMEARLEKD